VTQGRAEAGQRERVVTRLRQMAARSQARRPCCGSAWRVIPLAWKYCGRYAKSNRDRAAGRKERKVTGRELLIVNYDPPAA